MSELFIKQELFKALPNIDAILFDVDGVLLNVAESFRVVVCETVQHFAVHTLELKNTGPLITPEEVDLFKMAGGFNDDWDLTNAAMALVVAKWSETGIKETEALREAEPSWREFTDALTRRGGGLGQAEAYVLDRLTPSQRRDFALAWNAKLVTQLFQEMYAGDDACRNLYGFDPEYIHGEGFYKYEKPLVNPEFLPSKVKLGIVTGRTVAETRLALRHARLTGLIPEANWVTADDRVRKPDGATLLLARERMGFKNAIYLGDTMDDVQTVWNYRELKGAGKARLATGISLTGPSGDTHRRAFLEAGAEIITPDANMLLQYLKAALKK